MEARSAICKAAATKLRAATPDLKQAKAMVGFDGFVDQIIKVVDKRVGPEEYLPFTTIRDFGERINRAANQSTNMELVVERVKLGGNGPIMANALASAGMQVTYVGNLGFPALHPAFQPLADHAAVHSVAEPGQTDALEFTDGKLMLGKHEALAEVTWANVKERVGLDTLKSVVDGAAMLAANNWTMLPELDGIWQGLQDELLPSIAHPPKLYFFDLADPEKRTTESLASALRLLSGFGKFGDVTLGVNLKESGQVAKALGIDPSPAANPTLESLAAAIRAELGVKRVVIHPREGASACIGSETQTFQGPYVAHPKISTGAGDHFNAGFCLGTIAGMELVECLATGTATSGYYVREGESPTLEQLADFLDDLPQPE